jgi:hypothetical protein
MMQDREAETENGGETVKSRLGPDLLISQRHVVSRSVDWRARRAAILEFIRMAEGGR